MMTTYYTRRGTSRRRTPTPDIYALPGRNAPDDGRIILHVGDDSPTCADCGRGTLQWAEAGYVPWHRICDTCGSHWDLHPLGMGIGMIPYPEEPTCGGPASAQPRQVRSCYHIDRERCAEIAAGAEATLAAHETGIMLRCACPCHVPPSLRRYHTVPSVWRDGSGWVTIDPGDSIGMGRLDQYTGEPLGPPGKHTWGELLALIRPEHVVAAEADKDRTLGVPCVPACWARRARFYDR